MKRQTTLRRVSALCALFLVASLPWAFGASSPTLSLDGLHAFADAAGTVFPNSNTLHTFTVEAWIYPTQAGIRFIATDDGYDLKLYYTAGQPNGGLGIQFVLWNKNILPQSIVEYRGVQLSQWNHVAGLFDAVNGQMKLAVNGVLTTNPVVYTGGPLLSDPDFNFTVGQSGFGNSFFNGYIDEVRVSDTVRYASSFSPPSTLEADGNTLGLWHFDEPAGSTTFRDASGHGLSLTGHNGAQSAVAPGAPDITPPTGVCTFALSATNASHGAGSESGSFGVIAPDGCSWWATTTAGWIHTSSSGSGTNTVIYTVEANTNTSPRWGVIFVGGQTFTVNQAGIRSATAAFVGADAATQGNWQGKYGAEGYVVVNDATNYPSYATISPAGHLDNVWEWQASNDVRCLQKVTAPRERVAACWYGDSSFTMDVPVELGRGTRLALYCVDWDCKRRVQQVDLLDGVSGAVLDSQTLSNFCDGKYLAWNVSGLVRVRVTPMVNNAVVSGVFFDDVAASVRFVGVDAATQGDWTGKYGAEGYVVVDDATNYPSYATVSLAGQSDYVWEPQTTNVSCLQKATMPGQRVAACWYGNSSFTMDVAVGLGRATRLALYCLDWDCKGRVQQVDLLDGVSGAVLDSQTLSNFCGGKYLAWDVSGWVQVRVTPLVNNAVVSGVFFDGVEPSARFEGVDGATQGNWQGKYGAEGYVVVDDATSYPSYTMVSPAGQSDYVWGPQTTNVSCLQKATVPGQRVAACWYGDTRFTMDVTMGSVRATRLALYCLDWDCKGRVQQVDLLDGVSGAVLDSQTLSNFCGGKYLVWDVSGWVQVRVTPLVNNAVVSGVFFDDVAGPGVPSRIASISLSSEGAAQVVVAGMKGSTYYLEASDDLVTWSRVSTNVNSEGTVRLVDDGTASEHPIRFFRAVEAR